MATYRKKPVLIEATQWFENGDHPDDYANPREGLEGGELRTWTAEQVRELGWEGEVVRCFRRPDVPGETPCRRESCSRAMHQHGWIDTLEGGHIVCPGDWIITGVAGERYPCKDAIFRATYDLVADSAGAVPVEA